jgi:hypothetical protein
MDLVTCKVAKKWKLWLTFVEAKWSLVRITSVIELTDCDFHVFRFGVKLDAS